MKLYELTSEYIALQNMLEDANVEEESELVAALAAVAGDIEDKADAYARIMKNLLADVGALDQEERRLKARRKALENRIDWLKKAIQDAMTLTGARKLKTSIGNWSLRKNPYKLTVLDESKVPARFLIEQPPKIDCSGMLEEFKQTGELFDGVEISQGESVQFR